MINLIGSLREKYKKLEPVFCPYFGQEVLFTKKGFKHLIWKAEGRRNRKTIQNRFRILEVVPEIISKSGTLQEYENEGLEFFAFIAIVQKKKYKVIVIRIEDGTLRFFSVIPNWKTGKRDTPVLKNHPEG
jgi:hypothetical protein